MLLHSRGIKLDFQVSAGKRKERKALVKKGVIILGLSVPLRFSERQMKENWWWCLVLLGCTLQGPWSGLFHLSQSPYKKKTDRKLMGEDSFWKRIVGWSSDARKVTGSWIFPAALQFWNWAEMSIYRVRSRGHFFHSTASTIPKATTTTTIRVLRTMLPTVHSWATGPVVYK